MSTTKDNTQVKDYALPYAIHFNEGGYKTELLKVEEKRKHLQELVGSFLAVGYKLSQGDLELLHRDAARLLSNKFFDGKKLEIAGIPVSKENAFKLVDKPKGYDKLEATANKHKQLFSLGHTNIYGITIKSFKLDKTGTKVLVKQETLDMLRQRNTKYAKTEKSLKLYLKLKEIAAALNDINDNIQSVNIESFDVYDYFKQPSYQGKRTISVNHQIIR